MIAEISINFTTNNFFFLALLTLNSTFEMHHGKHVRRLNRTSAHRKAMLRNMVSALIKHERIETTLPKAKELKKIADKMITIGKKGDFNAKRSAMAYLRVRTARFGGYGVHC